MTEHQFETVKVQGRSEALLLCLVCLKTYELAQLPAAPGGGQSCPADGSSLMVLPAVDSKLVGNYVYKGLLGVGGMGVVFKAHNPYLDRMVAIKNLKGKRYDQQQLQRFIQEGKLLGKLVHPNLVSVLDFGANEIGEPYMVMEYLEGQSLASVISRSGTIAFPLALEILIQACEGLASAHRFGAVHRDIKPSNIFIMDKPGGKPLVKLLDFGIAKLCFPEDPAASADLTRTGEIFGSPLYISPEQALGKTVDERADLYSLGCVMYEMLTGQPPVMGTTAMETIFKHITDTPLPLSKAAPRKEFPACLQSLLDCLLAKEPDNRVESAEQLAKILSGIADGKTDDLEQLQTKSIKQAVQTTKDRVSPGAKKDHPAPSFTAKTVIIVLVAQAVIVFGAAYIFATIYKATPPVPKYKPPALVSIPQAEINHAANPDVSIKDEPISKIIGDNLTKEDVDRQFLQRQLAKRGASIDITDQDLGPADFKLLAEQGQFLGRLAFKADSGLTAQSIALLHNLPVAYIEFQECDINDSGLAALAKLPAMRHLTVRHCPELRPMALAGLKGLGELSLLHYEGVFVDPQALKEILPMRSLNTLKIFSSGNSIGNSSQPKMLRCNAALPEIGRCQALNFLELSASDVTGAGMASLTPLKLLNKLHLDNCPRVDDTAVDSFVKMPNLQELAIRGTAITPQGLERLLKNSKLKHVFYSNRVGKLSPYLESQATARRLSF